MLLNIMNIRIHILLPSQIHYCHICTRTITCLSIKLAVTTNRLHEHELFRSAPPMQACYISVTAVCDTAQPMHDRHAHPNLRGLKPLDTMCVQATCSPAQTPLCHRQKLYQGRCQTLPEYFTWPLVSRLPLEGHLEAT